MILKLSRLIRARAHGDEGIAMIMVMGTIGVLTIMLGVTLAYAISVQPQARHDQDWNASLAAAQSGVDDYVAKLNQNDSYWTTVDCTNLALKGPKAGTNTCGWTTTTTPGWQQIDTGNAGAGSFHYDVDSSTLNAKGAIRVTSTGNVRNVKRSLQVLVQRGGPTNFLYYTDFEDADPGNALAYPSGAPNNNCGKAGPTLAQYWWNFNGTGARDNTDGCVEIQFVSFDVLNGKAHFNDTPYLGGSATFKQGYETSDPKCATLPYNAANCVRSGNALPTLGAGYTAQYAPKLDLPDNSSAFVNDPGCFYTGDTRIRFLGDGTMDVWNTASAGTTLLGPGTPAGTNCGIAANFTSPAVKQNVPVPDDMVIYIKNSATTGVCSVGQVVNGTTSGSTANDVIPTGDGTGMTSWDVNDISYNDPDTVVTTTTKTFTRATGTSGLAWTNPAATVALSETGDGHPATFDCGQGNLYVEGDLKGSVTMAAQNNVIVTNNLTTPATTPPTDGSGNVVDASGSDIAGLVAANSVIVYHPVSRDSVTGAASVTSGTNCSATVGNVPTSTTGTMGTSDKCVWSQTQTFNNTASTANDIAYPGQTNSTTPRAIYASIETLQHSFWVDNYKYGNPLGKLSVRGSIAQKWRGIVGTGTTATSTATGFNKDYGYDTRLKFLSPPYFPQWTKAQWDAQTTGELKPQY
jgi:hypothetical protein